MSVPSDVLKIGKRYGLNEEETAKFIVDAQEQGKEAIELLDEMKKNNRAFLYQLFKQLADSGTIFNFTETISEPLKNAIEAQGMSAKDAFIAGAIIEVLQDLTQGVELLTKLVKLRMPIREQMQLYDILMHSFKENSK